MQQKERFEPKISSNVQHVDYEAKEKRLTVCFKSGKSYTYEGVDEGTFQDLKGWPSTGQFISRYIVNHFNGVAQTNEVSKEQEKNHME